MTTKEMAEVMLAYDRGEQIQSKSEIHYCFDNEPEWEDIKDNETPTWDWSSFSYRVKPKKNFVPFDTPEEFLEAQRVHGTVLTDDELKYYSSVDSKGYVTLIDTYYEERPFTQTFEYVCKYLKF